MVATRTSLNRQPKAGCSFCPENGKVDIIAISASGLTYLIQVLVKTERGMRPANGAYFVIPVDHHQDYSTLEFDFLKEVTELKAALGLIFDNEGFNMTAPGGKQSEHMHYWMMQVQDGDEHLGLYTLRAVHREVRKELALTRNELARFRAL